MKATEASLLGFLKNSPQFTIPIYQRTYSWNKAQCRQLWDDILRAGVDVDVADRGHWGTGDAEVGLSKREELPYVMGLVRQALEKQLGNGEG